MALATVTWVERDTAGNKVAGVVVTAHLVPSETTSFDGVSEIIGVTPSTTSAADGSWSLSLERTDTMTPLPSSVGPPQVGGMRYAITRQFPNGQERVDYIGLGAGGGTLPSLVTAPPTAPPAGTIPESQVSNLVADLAARVMSVTAGTNVTVTGTAQNPIISAGDIPSTIPADGTLVAGMSGSTPTLRVNLGTSGTSATAGNDARLSDMRTPLDGSVTVAKLASGFVVPDGNLPTDIAFLDGTAPFTTTQNFAAGIGIPGGQAVEWVNAAASADWFASAQADKSFLLQSLQGGAFHVANPLIVDDGFSAGGGAMTVDASGDLSARTVIGGGSGVANVAGTFDALGATSPALIVRGFASQTADLQQWRDANNTILAHVDASGALHFGGGSGTVQADAGGVLNLLAGQVQTAHNILDDGSGNATFAGQVGTGGGLGVWGRTPPGAQPTGTPAAATDLASAIALVNFLRTNILATGLIAT